MILEATGNIIKLLNIWSKVEGGTELENRDGKDLTNAGLLPAVFYLMCSYFKNICKTQTVNF